MQQINNLFQQVLSQIQVVQGINSPQYQSLQKEQQTAATILEKASPEEQVWYLGLIQQIRSLFAKTADLSVVEQQRMIALSQEADEFIEKLQKQQVKVEQRDRNNKLAWVIGGSLVGLGLIGLVVWLVRRKGK